jgi:hypothetical protein
LSTIVEPRPVVAPRTATSALDVSAETAYTLVVSVLLLSSSLIMVGLLWDISWHLSIGRDTLWTAPHVLEQVGASLAGIACGLLVLRTTFGGSAEQRARSVRFWGFRGPLGAWVAIWGAFAMAFSVPFDDWWHNAYGLDVKILSPPHVVLLLGMVGIQLGAMFLALSVQNRSDGQRASRFGFAFAFAAGVMVAMLLTTLSQYMIRANDWHTSMAYRVAAMPFPLMLAAVARAGRLRYPATVAALCFMGVYLVPQWVIVQFPATPRLTPILNPITNMAAFAFPLVLVAPALAFDLLLRKWNAIGDWKLALSLSLAFVVTMLAVHWPFGTFLLRSPLAQNDLFLANHWAYSTTLGPWRTQFFSESGTLGGPFEAPKFLIGIAWAFVYGTLSARAGLGWGSWMRRVRR